MNKTILICLAAVVVITIIIALAALRFLRADDSDPFEEPAHEPRHPSRASDDSLAHDRVPVAAATRHGRPAPGDEPNWQADRSADMRQARSARDPGSRPRPAPDRSAGTDRRGQAGLERPAPAAARSATSSRAAGQDAGPDWETMSDVDYWAELAAEKPFSTVGAGSPSSASTRRAQDSASDARRADGRPSNDRQPGRSDPAPVPLSPRQGRPTAAAARADRQGQLPDSRPGHAGGRYTDEIATQSIAALTRLGSPSMAAQAPAAQSGQSRPVQSRPASHPGQQPRSGPQPMAESRTQPRSAQPVPLDDDPLTSPSFPAVSTSDSRSYRSSRSRSQPGSGRGTAVYGEPTQQFNSYPAASHAIGAPSDYPVKPAAITSPSGNPYGSFVSQPPAYRFEAPTASSPDTGYGGYAAQPGTGGDGWYPNPAPLAGTGQALPAHSQAGYALGEAVTNGYEQADYAGLQPDPSYPDPSYQQEAYRGLRYDQSGYAGQDVGYGPDSYQEYPGYGTNGY